jgi:murein DD-endopeptidase MepM/ murein hydrolase activator NlpD
MKLKNVLMLATCFIGMSINMSAQHNWVAYSNTNETTGKIVLDNARESMPAANLYDLEWNTVWCHAYKNLSVPNEYKIDLREFHMPIKHTMVTSRFGYRPRFGRNHYGVDIKGYTGDSIYAAWEGKVRVVKNDPTGYGNVVIIRHPNGLETVYGHLSKQLVKTNQYVKSGEVIGLCGNTGRSFGSHLHFETRLCGVAIDPEKIFTFSTRDVTGDYFTFRK